MPEHSLPTAVHIPTTSKHSAVETASIMKLSVLSSIGQLVAVVFIGCKAYSTESQQTRSQESMMSNQSGLGANILYSPAILSKPTDNTSRNLNGFEVQFVANPCKNAFDGGPCLECTGDCDNDSDCAGDLRCAQRSGQSGNVNVPGCVWGEGSDDLRFDDDDFCTLMCSSFWASCGLFACVD